MKLSTLSYTICLESENMYRESENMVRESFWDIYKPGCDEHLVLYKMRNISSFIKDLDLVAIKDRKVIGIIVFTLGQVISAESKTDILFLGPIAVLPEYQNMGIGSKLINESIEKAKKMGFKGIFLTGNPKYYGKFGFVETSKYNIKWSDGNYHDYFMCLELSNNGLQKVSGIIKEDDVYYVDKNELEEFESRFPKKEKHITDSQLK